MYWLFFRNSDSLNPVLVGVDLGCTEENDSLDNEMTYEDMCLYKHIEQEIEDFDLIFVFEAPICHFDALVRLCSLPVQAGNDHQLYKIKASSLS